MKCPNCGYEFYAQETLNTEWDVAYYDYVIGTCPNCNKTYTWTEVYTFERVEDIQEDNAE
jgi:endogenous inhibitor of DNA gyrase (YacG/DUF329 family)